MPLIAPRQASPANAGSPSGNGKIHGGIRPGPFPRLPPSGAPEGGGGPVAELRPRLAHLQERSTVVFFALIIKNPNTTTPPNQILTPGDRLSWELLAGAPPVPSCSTSILAVSADARPGSGAASSTGWGGGGRGEWGWRGGRVAVDDVPLPWGNTEGAAGRGCRPHLRRTVAPGGGEAVAVATAAGVGGTHRRGEPVPRPVRGARCPARRLRSAARWGCRPLPRGGRPRRCQAPIPACRGVSLLGGATCEPERQPSGRRGRRGRGILLPSLPSFPPSPAPWPAPQRGRPRGASGSAAGSARRPRAVAGFGGRRSRPARLGRPPLGSPGAGRRGGSRPPGSPRAGRSTLAGAGRRRLRGSVWFPPPRERTPPRQRGCVWGDQCTASVKSRRPPESFSTCEHCCYRRCSAKLLTFQSLFLARRLNIISYIST